MARRGSPPLELLQLARTFRREVESALGVPVLVTLFGSWARGDAMPDSDVDLLTVVPQRSPEVEERVWDVAWRLSLAAERLLAACVVGEDELPLLSSSPLWGQLRREGIPV